MTNIKKFFYGRVSTKEQNEARQLKQAKQLKIDARDIFIDKANGSNFDRPEYERLLHHLRAGDILYISSLDRLGRDYKAVLEQWKHITEDIKADIVVLDMPILDTTKNKDLLGNLISDIVLSLLSYVAETEKAKIKERQKQGIEIAKKEGKYKGRKKIERPANWNEVYTSWKAGNITGRKAMEELGLKNNTFYKLVKEYEQEQGAI